MSQDRFDNLGNLSADHYDPSAIDPYSLQDIDRPGQPAGPVPAEYLNHGVSNNGNGKAHPQAQPQAPQARPQAPQPSPFQPVDAAQVPSSGGDPWSGMGGMDANHDAIAHDEMMQRYAIPAPVPQQVAPVSQQQENREKGRTALIVVGAATAAALGMYYWMKKKR